ncbi:MAG: PfkB family carbohydrate kinase [Cuniculiplasma sp.]
MTSNRFLAYTGHLNLDVVLRVNEINDNVTLPVSEVTETFGGTAGNFVTVAQELGLDFRLYSIVSSNSHSGYIDRLRQLNVDLAGVRIVESGYGPVCYAINDGRKQKYFLAEGPMKTDHYTILDEHYSYLHLGTGNPYLNTEMIEKANYSKSVFDPSQEVFFKYSKEDLSYFLENCNYIMGNEDEIDFIFRNANVEINSYVGEKHTVIKTRGSQGADVYAKKHVHVFPFAEINEGGDTLGAGDSFRAGFYLGLRNGMSAEDAVKCGNVVSYDVVKTGVDEFKVSAEDVLSMAKKLKIESIA